MSIKNRLEKLERTTAGGLHSLGIIEAKPKESASDAVARIASERGLTFEQIGFAWVWWPDNSDETYQTVDDPTSLIGWISHDQALEELD